jgi:hypothetical protein
MCRDGSSFIVVFKVGDYPEVGAPWEFSEEDRKRLPRWEREGTGYKLNGLFALALREDPQLNFRSGLDAFEAIVKCLCSYSDFATDAERYFFVIMGVARIDVGVGGQRTSTVVPISRTGSYSLVSGKEYEMRVYVFAPEESPTTSIKVTALHIHSETKAIEFPLAKSR